ncbi:MAG: exonuclease SbcCD subunit D C-terminal domain-containing protein [Desulfuromonadaceae bacterium]|nr:exonuclease SbcCD subunit D C-terminal domain-containing protein [Desulfuromonadaceae bacterium]MDD2849348.1 exonuclease SbcCD subunit D C-terminal domain-containing protein [Desulfuromonadaceae bacterium]MDD4129407.1 exonuclease SbcCD subunit D C-terminal domain-containing protein [Desulfuromonadaceae bacterium]
MKILHTSDWHIGRALYGRKRYREYEEFLDWLIGCIETEGVEVLLLAGDVFDNGTPSNMALELYYRFLCRCAAAGCRHVVVTAGNHDSPSLINAPREVLRFLNVHVVGSIAEAVKDELVVLNDGEGKPELIVCAVPYLRDRDIRRAEAGETFEDKGRKLVEGISAHYRDVGAAAVARRAELGEALHIIAMGHLFTSGGQTVEGDGVRELYVGTLGQVRADVFPDCFAYLALGHLHTAQRVGGSEFRRYSGAPLPMSFGEAGGHKIMLLLNVDDSGVAVQEVPVPCFQQLETVRGDWSHISGRISALKNSNSSVWLEVIYEGVDVIGDLQERLRELVDGTAVEILRAKNMRLVERVMSRMAMEETLDDLTVADVFARCLTANEVPLEQHAELVAVFQEAVAALHEDDTLGQL